MGLSEREYANLQIKQSIEILSNYKIATIIKDDHTFRQLMSIKQFISSFNDYKFLLKKKIYRLLSKILFKIYENRTNLSSIDRVYINLIGNQSNRSFAIIYLCLAILNNVYLNSIKFSQNFVKYGGIKVLSLFLKDDLLSKIQNVKIIDIEEVDLIDFLVLNLYNLSETAENNIKVWQDQDIVSLLLKLVDKKPSVKLDAFLTISEIAKDDEIESLSEIGEIVDYLQNQLVKVSDKFSQLSRCRRQKIYQNSVKEVEVLCILDNEVLTSIDTYIRGLYKLAVNDKLRKKIFFTKLFFKNLLNIFMKGNTYESECCLKLYTQLSFDSEIATEMRLDTLLVSSIESKQKEKSLTKLCDQILWNIRDKIQVEEKTSKHVMISYNSASRGLCLKIKKELRQIGLKVWIDVDKIHGSSLDSMAKAVEMSFCVLVCITEKYRLSEFCQAEATYAFRLKKPIIPLIMQKGYENVNGWLGIIQKDRINVNFTKYSYDDCIRRLKHELANLSIIPLENFQIGTNAEENLVETWNEDKVTEWFKINELNTKIFDLIRITDGRILQQLFEMRKDAPEFYFQLLKSNRIDAYSMLKFTYCLKKLFETK